MKRTSPRLSRRTLVAFSSALAWPALAADIAGPMQTYEATTGGRIGVFAKNLVSGATLSWRADERFVMCSTFKASLAALVLSRVDRGEDALDRQIAFGEAQLEAYAPIARQHLLAGAMSVAQMCEAAVEYSDNTCATLLLARVGGPLALTAYWRGLGDGLTRLDHNEPLLNRSPPGDPHDTTTPRAMADNLRKLAQSKVLSAASRQQFIAWLVGSKTGGDRLRGGLPKSWRIGDKTGNNGRDAFGDIAIAWPGPDRPVVMGCYTQGGAPRPYQVESVFAAVGQMVGERLG